jgi:acetate kinase
MTWTQQTHAIINMTTTFIVDSGKYSKKYALFNEGVCMWSVGFESSDVGYVVHERGIDSQQSCRAADQSEFANAFSFAFDQVQACIKKYRLDDVTEVVIKISVPGTLFQQHCLITADYEAELKKREAISPQHIRLVLRELAQCRRSFPDAELFAASDSAFHATMPRYAREYSLSLDSIRSLDLYRFGVDGLSVSSVVGRIHSIIGIDPERMVVCHINNDGASVTAVHKGVSIDTTAGFAPTSGFPSRTYAGDVDASTLLRIMKSKNLNATEAELFLSTQGGFQTVTGSSDMNSVLKQASQNDEQATHSLQLFTYKTQQAIAAAAAALGGFDALVFTGCVGVRSSELRAMILETLTFLDLQINEERNSATMESGGVISQRNSGVKVVVLKGDELSELNAVVKKVQLSTTKN